MTPVVMYWPGSNGTGGPSKRTQKLARSLDMSSRRTRVALYCSASAAMTRESSSWWLIGLGFLERAERPGRGWLA